MEPHDRLDVLLSSRAASQRRRALLEGQRDVLEPLVALADDLAGVSTVVPPAAFADELESRILARARHQAVGGFQVADRGPAAADAALQAGNGHARDDGAVGYLPPVPAILTLRGPRRSGPRRASRFGIRHVRWRVWTSLAAAVMLSLCVATFALAANADPGGPLYGLRSWQEDARANLATSAADRARSHLQYAADALGALDAAVAQRTSTEAYHGALSRFTDELQQAVDALAQVPTGTDRDTLTAQLDDLRTRGRSDLRAALPALDWPARIKTTSALGTLGEPVVVVTRVSSMLSGSWPTRIWTLTITGSGFQSGAILLVRERPAGQVLSVTPTRVIAQFTGGGEEDDLPHDIGIGNPDGTAATTGQATGTRESGGGATPTTTIPIPGQTLTLHGDVDSVDMNAGSFVLE
ncbi:MAG TPA: hypothetical protein VGS80_24940, partial [Ktedonobacterales bacterium]|nr:hypothetical protein [Ktedonobacterales bacterium]